MDFNVALNPPAAVKVGKPGQSFTINVSRVQPDAAAKYKVTVTLSCGPREADLLGSPNDLVYVRWRQDAKTTNMSAVTNPQAGARAWNTGPFPVGLSLSISLESFASNTPPGDAVIIVLVQTSAGPNLWSAGETTQVMLKKELEPQAAPAIRYFTINPNYVLHAGQTEITASFCATGYDTLTLFRNNEEIRNWNAPEGATPTFIGTFPSKEDFPERPSITSVYRLEGKYRDKQSGEGMRHTLDQTVQVISSGWNQIAMPQGSPVRLFVANDFGGSGSERLYGIFKNRAGYYALYSSATGVDDWRPEAGEVPQEMATSPGVVFKNKLWLVGGSSVDPRRPGAQVWCYDKDHWRNKSDISPPEPAWSFPAEASARMGHACVVFKDQLWVIGGFSGRPFNDVWALSEAPDGTISWTAVSKNCPWAARLNPAAVRFRRSAGQDQVWIYGGSKSPQSDPLGNEFWSTSDGVNWQNMSQGQVPDDDRPVPITPDPGAPLGSALVSFEQKDWSGNSQGARLVLLGSFQESGAGRAGAALGNRIFSFLFEWHSGTALWEARPVFDGWQQFQGQNFYMQAVFYNGFLFCWSLPNDQTLSFNGRLNVLVSR